MNVTRRQCEESDGVRTVSVREGLCNKLPNMFVDFLASANALWALPLPLPLPNSSDPSPSPLADTFLGDLFLSAESLRCLPVDPKAPLESPLLLLE